MRKLNIKNSKRAPKKIWKGRKFRPIRCLPNPSALFTRSENPMFWRDATQPLSRKTHQTIFRHFTHQIVFQKTIIPFGKSRPIKINLDRDAFGELRGCVILQSGRFVKYERRDFSFLRGKTSNYTLPCKTFVSITFRVQHIFFSTFENRTSARSVCCVFWSLTRVF